MLIYSVDEVFKLFIGVIHFKLLISDDSGVRTHENHFFNI